ncbi:ABC transporter permease [Persicobacter sp. CCB-QB2]|uniref:ABC transporter permease n=1 Tax=Persicobacter sp. CCB-QB2 TaxID=1561025 RepID=UPI0006A9EBBF|nr:ABC transporter permease [Persicobacter sp. CCB-QB2]
MKTLFLIWESFRSALTALKSNLLRTILSLLGVTVGIFAIIGVFTLVDSLENGIKKSLDFLGGDLIYVEKWPWGVGGEYPWWKYLQRPHPTYEEFRFLEDNLKGASGIAIQAMKDGVTFKKDNNSASGMMLMGISHQYDQMMDLKLEQGRFFTQLEASNGRGVVIIGHDLGQQLFPLGNALGQTVMIKGNACKVIGVLPSEGENLVSFIDKDKTCFVPFNFFRKVYYVGKKNGIGASIVIKGFPEDEGLEKLEGELVGMMRRLRGQKPVDENNFAVNRPEVIAGAIENIFGVLTLAGAVIGLFSILVGGFGIANIMFVSVKERTNLIGIQKALGAKRFYILFQFLFEAVLLSLAGGAAGLVLVYGLTYAPTGSLELSLSFKNILVGLMVSSIIGLVSGLIPASVAAKMDPVVAIRQ